MLFRPAAGRRVLFALVALIPLSSQAYSGATVIGTLSGQDTPAVLAWKEALIERLRSHVGVPQLPQSLKGDGIVLLTFAVDRDGHVHDARISRSSGSALLDQFTLEIPYAAEPFPKPPDDLIGDHFSFTVPLRYHLTHEQN